MAIFPGSAIPSAVSDYEIDNSLRFNSPDSAYLSRTVGTATSNKVGTVSFWVKRGASMAAVIGNYSDSNNNTYINFYADKFEMYGYLSGSTQIYLATSALYRDPAAWYHFVVAVDTTQVTAANRIKCYVNGEQITVWPYETYPGLNEDVPLFSTTNMTIGTRAAGASSNLSAFWDGYMAEFYYVDGTQLLPSSFGELKSTTNQWIPKDAKDDLTFGTNGFYQKYGSTEDADVFTDSA